MANSLGHGLPSAKETHNTMPRKNISPKMRRSKSEICIDGPEIRNFEVVKSTRPVTHVLRSAFSERRFVTIRNNQLELVTDSGENDVFEVYKKINRKMDAIQNYFIVCFTKRVGEKTFCLVPKFNDCYSEVPSKMDLTIQELPPDWKHDHDEIPKNEYKFWFQHIKNSSHRSTFRSFHSPQYVLQIEEDGTLILCEMDETDSGDMPMSSQFQFMPLAE